MRTLSLAGFLAFGRRAVHPTQWAAPALALVLAACGGGTLPSDAPTSGKAASAPTPRGTGGAKPTPPPAGAVAAAAAPGAKAGRLPLAEARRHMLALINRDRASEGLPPVVLEEGPAQVAAQRHAEDMAKNGFLGHYGSDGSVPEQRYTEAGGADFVMENAACVTDEKRRDLDPAPLIEVAALEHTEQMFFGEVPPHDGHRKNILRPEHKKVGIGLAQHKGTATELPALCLTQEFIDPYGDYAPIPKQARAGDRVVIAGRVRAPAKFGGVALARVDAPRPLPPRELNKRRSYTFPEPYEIYWPRGFKTPLPVEVRGDEFRIEVPLGRGPGLYSVAVLAQHPGQKAFGSVSVRTLVVQ